MFSHARTARSLLDVAVRLGADRPAVQLRLERRVVVDARVDLERDAVAQVIHAARRHRQPERERLQDPRVVRIALHQALHGHAVLQRLRRDSAPSPPRASLSASTLPKPSRADIMNSSRSIIAASPHVQLEAAGVRGRDDAALDTARTPTPSAEPVEAVSSPRSLQMLLRRITDSTLSMPRFGPNLPSVTYSGPSPLPYLSARLAVQIVQRPAVHRAAEAAFHARAILIEVLRVEPVGPGRLLVVLGAHRAEQPAWLVEKRRAGHRQRVLDHGRRQQLLRDVAVVGLVRLRGRELARLRDA